MALAGYGDGVAASDRGARRAAAKVGDRLIRALFCVREDDPMRSHGVIADDRVRWVDVVAPADDPARPADDVGGASLPWACHVDA